MRSQRWLLCWACPLCGAGLNNRDGAQYGSLCGACKPVGKKPGDARCEHCSGLLSNSARARCSNWREHGES